jgi:hypothetical protein
MGNQGGARQQDDWGNCEQEVEEGPIHWPVLASEVGGELVFGQVEGVRRPQGVCV